MMDKQTNNFREKKLDFWMFFPWRTPQVMLQAGASHKTAGYRNGSIKTLLTTIK